MAGTSGRGSPSGTARAATLALAGAFRPAGVAGRLEWQGWLKACIAEEVEQRRLFPWLAVAFGCGVLLYFSAEGTPALWAPLVGVAGGIAASVLARARP